MAAGLHAAAPLQPGRRARPGARGRARRGVRLAPVERRRGLHARGSRPGLNGPPAGPPVRWGAAMASAQPLQHPAFETVVMKFGGSSVADAEKVRGVAERLVRAKERGVRVVGTVSAMGKTTDSLISLAREVSPEPDPREMDMLLSTGERISCALVAMAIHDLGHEAVSLTGSQAGIVTDAVHTKAKIVDIRARRVVEALDQGKIVLVAGFQGISDGTLDVTTLGRGGTDATAVALAAALD